MHHLKAPNKIPRRSPQRHHRVGPLVITLADAAVVVRSRAAGGNEYQIMLGIHGESGPSVRSASARCSFVGPRRWVPGPAQLAGANIVSANDATLGIDLPIVSNGRADDDEILGDGGRGSDLVAA